MEHSSEELLPRQVEIKFTFFLAEHNIPITKTDHLGSL